MFVFNINRKVFILFAKIFDSDILFCGYKRFNIKIKIELDVQKIHNPLNIQFNFNSNIKLYIQGSNTYMGQ